MPRKTVDKTGKTIKQTPSTKTHPEGNRARTADGRVFDDQGHPVAPTTKQPAARVSRPSPRDVVDPADE